MLKVQDREILRRECRIGELVRPESNVLHEIEGRLVRDAIPAIRGDLTEQVDSESEQALEAGRAGVLGLSPIFPFPTTSTGQEDASIASKACLARPMANVYLVQNERNVTVLLPFMTQSLSHTE
jgi:hypothetical protein